ncbi:MAG TPA: type II secretion system F family protein [Pirellula sp.]|nr:type II secretion system F family protein [Pirellula sp.]
MSSINERPDFYQRIDAALERRHKLASAIEALSEETKSRRIATDVHDLLCALRGGATTELFVQDGSKAVWLPLILRGVSSSVSTVEFKQIMSDVTFATENRKSRWRSFAYPLVVFGIAILVFVLISVMVLPTFQNMFREFGLRLPLATRSLLEISNQINERPVVFCLSLLGVMLAAWGLRRFVLLCMRYTDTTWLFGSLTAGNTESVKAMGRFTSTLAELLNVGAPLNEAILIAGRASQNLRFRNASEILSRDIGSSEKFSYESTVAHNFPALVAHALEAGPNGGPSIALLRQVSAIYIDRVRHRFSWSAGFLAPLSIVGIGLCVGFVVIAIFLPLVSLITSLSG